MVYNNDIKKWEHAGGSQGISQVDVYHNLANNNYRIIGRKADTNEVCIACAGFVLPLCLFYLIQLTWVMTYSRIKQI